MDIKSLFSLLLDPKLLAAAGGYLSWHFLGKSKGKLGYLYGAGGAAAGYAVGYLAGKYLAPAVVATQQKLAEAQWDGTERRGRERRRGGQWDGVERRRGERRTADLLDLGFEPPTHRTSYAPPPVQERPDAELAEDLGSYGMGSYAPSVDGDVDTVEVLREHGFKVQN